MAGLPDYSNLLASPTLRHPSEYPPPPQHHRMLQPLSTERYLHFRGSVQRYSHRRVAAHACGISARPQELSTAPKTWKCRLLALHDLRAVERRTGVLGRGCLVSSYGGFAAASCQRHGSCVWRRDFAGRAGTCHFHQSSVVFVRSRRLRPVSKESRLLCQKPGREGILLYRRGHDLVMRFCCALILTCYRFERSDGYGR